MKKTRMKKRTLLCIIMALVIALGSISVVSAEVAIANIGVVRYSDTSGRASANGEFDKTADTCSVKMILQEKYDGSWRTATGVPIKSVEKRGSNSDDIYLSYEFTLAKGKVYRIKATFTDTQGSTTYGSTYYSSIF